MAVGLPGVRRGVMNCLLIWVGFVTAAEAQDALRMSLAGEQAARARREAATTLGYYNLMAGPTAWRFASGLGLEWSDNVRLSGLDPESDFIARPEIDARMLWPITEKNALNLTLGAGYSAYVENPDLSRFFVRPGSEVSLDLYTGDFNINLHDRFSILQDAYQDPTVVGAGNYSRLENAIGVGTLWDLNKALVRAGYDHINYLSLTGAGNLPDGQAEMFFGSAGLRLGSIALAGTELGGGLVHYNSGALTDITQWNAGVFGETVVSEYIQARASAGYMVYSPTAEDTAGMADLDGIYFQLALRHRLNQYLTYSLSGGRTVNFVFYGGSVDNWFVRWTGSWALLRKFTLETSLDYQKGEELQWTREKYDWYGGSIQLGRALTSHLTAGVGYRGYVRSSDLPSRDYVVNTVGLQFRYQF